MAAGEAHLSPPASYPRFRELVPKETLREGRYAARFAHDPQDLEALLRLRFEVFNLELGEGLEESYLTGLDRDRFDAVCHHLVVTGPGEQEGSEAEQVVGTYRMQTSAMAEQGLGFYSDVEFDLSTIPGDVLGNAVEVGRACVGLDHRNTQVLYLLWKGLARYMATNHQRYLFGCCSLTSQDPAEGFAMMRHLEAEGYVHPTVQVVPRCGFECYDPAAPPDLGVEPGAPVKVPKLFRTYLRHGALVCGPPAIDREFKTIDFLVIFDVAAMGERRFKMFFG